MDFSLTQEQVLLRDNARRFVGKHCTVERHRALSAREPGFDPDTWRQFAELGWLGLPFGARDGGFDGGPVELMVLAEAFGGALVREPYLITVVTCGTMLSRGGRAEQREAHIPGIIDGSAQWAFACAEEGTGYDLTRAASRATPRGDGYVLDGRKIAVLNGNCADRFIVSAQAAGSDVPALFIVDAGAAGVSREPFVCVDGSRGAHLNFDGVRLGRVDLLGGIGAAPSLILAAIDTALVAIGAEALGAMQSLLDATVEYTKTRRQFGQPIGKFQVLQHRMADMYMKVEQTRSLLLHAAIRLQEGSDDAPRACAALKVKVGEAGRFVSQQAVQLHGGIGMTEELVVGHHYKRLLLLDKLFGDEHHHLRRFAGQGASPA